MQLLNRNRKEKEPLPGSSRRERNSEILHIVCRGCSQEPDCGSPECISCMCEAVSAHGAASKIRLEGSKDTEIYGEGAELVSELARIRRPLIRKPEGRGCRNCPLYPENVVDVAWRDFPDPDFDAARALLSSPGYDDSDCRMCIQRTNSAIAVCEKDMEAIRSRTGCPREGN